MRSATVSGNLILHLYVQKTFETAPPTEFPERRLIPRSALLEKLGTTLEKASEVRASLREADLLTTLIIQVRHPQRDGLRADCVHYQPSGRLQGGRRARARIPRGDDWWEPRRAGGTLWNALRADCARTAKVTSGIAMSFLLGARSGASLANSIENVPRTTGTEIATLIS